MFYKAENLEYYLREDLSHMWIKNDSEVGGVKLYFVKDVKPEINQDASLAIQLSCRQLIELHEVIHRYINENITS